jgi:hypothetical protein
MVSTCGSTGVNGTTSLSLRGAYICRNTDSCGCSPLQTGQLHSMAQNTVALMIIKTTKRAFIFVTSVNVSTVKVQELRYLTSQLSNEVLLDML